MRQRHGEVGAPLRCAGPHQARLLVVDEVAAKGAGRIKPIMVLRYGGQQLVLRLPGRAMGHAARHVGKSALAVAGQLEHFNQPALVGFGAGGGVGQVAAQHQQACFGQGLRRAVGVQGARQQALRHGGGGVSAITGIGHEVDPEVRLGRRGQAPQVAALEGRGEGFAAVQVAQQLGGPDLLAQHLPQPRQGIPGHRQALVGRVAKAVGVSHGRIVGRGAPRLGPAWRHFVAAAGSPSQARGGPRGRCLQFNPSTPHTPPRSPA